MDDLLKVWTTVGSAGTLNQADLAKVSLHQSIIQLGVDLGPAQPATAHVGAAALQVGPNLATNQAVVRYNVTPVDGLYRKGEFKYTLQIRFRGKISAKLMEVDLSNGNETQLILFDFPATPGFQVQFASVDQDVSPVRDTPVLDFVNKAYYVEATLVAPALVIGHPAAISIIKLLAEPVL